MTFRDANLECKIAILDFAIGEKRILTMSLKESAKKYFETTYPEYYRDYLAGNKGRIYLTALVVNFDKVRQKLTISLYEEKQSTNGVGTSLVKFEQVGYFNNKLQLKLPLLEIYNFVICQIQKSQQ